MTRIMLGAMLHDSTYSPVWYETIGGDRVMDGDDRRLPSNHFPPPREAPPYD